MTNTITDLLEAASIRYNTEITEDDFPEITVYPETDQVIEAVYKNGDIWKETTLPGKWMVSIKIYKVKDIAGATGLSIWRIYQLIPELSAQGLIDKNSKSTTDLKTVVKYIKNRVKKKPGPKVKF